MDDILLLQSDQRAAAALIGALDPPHRVRAVADFKELEVLLRSVTPQACILDLFDPPPSIPFPTLSRLRRKHPTVALIIASDFDGREMDLYHLGRLSVDGVIRMDAGPSARDILAVVDKAIAAALATLVVLGVRRRNPTPGAGSHSLGH